jgi:alkyl-hydroperoxide reductase/thiol specific antioxidant family protein
MQLHRARKKLAATGGDVVLVGMGTPAHARNFKEETGVEFPILLSRDKAAYRAMDLKRGSTREVFAPRQLTSSALRVLGVGAGRAKGGNLALRPAQQDWHQFGGAFVVAPGGELVFEQRAGDPSDTASVEDLERALKKAAPE